MLPVLGIGKSKDDSGKAKAVVKVQCAYRCHLAKERSRSLYLATHMKVYDETHQIYYYKHKVNFTTTKTKPRFLGNFDLPYLRQNGEHAPDDYNPGTELTGNGCLLIVTSSNFQFGRWEEISDAVNREHDQLNNILRHEFIGKFQQENIWILKNPPTTEFKSVFKSIRRQCKASGFLTVYVATHVVTVINGEKENKKENAYFAFSNSVWGSISDIAETCISLTTFCTLMNKVACKNKTVILNYAHVAKPSALLFASSKAFYPPEDFLSRLAVQGKCAVIGCCAIGASVKEYLTYSTFHQENSSLSDKYTDGKLGKTKGSSNSAAKENTKHDDVGIALNKKENTKHYLHNAKDNVIHTSKHQLNHISNDKNEQFHQQQHIRTASSTQRHAALLAELVQEWKVTLPPEISRTPRPIKPTATWHRGEVGGSGVVIMLPDQKARKNYSRRLLYWYMKRFLAMPGNVIKQQLRTHRLLTIKAPYQTSLVEGGYTLFGRALINAFRGGACNPARDYVTVVELFNYIRDHMQKSLDRMNAVAAVRYQQANTAVFAAAGGGGSNSSVSSKPSDNSTNNNNNNTTAIPVVAPPPPPVLTQSPVLFILPGYEQHQNIPVCFRCGPPAAPDRPYIIRTGDNEVLLEWYNPDFDGVAASRYKVAMLNCTRNFNKWTDLLIPGDITKTRYLVHNLPRGVSCQFKISGYNNAGWGQYSESSTMVVPGELHEVLPDAIRWSRLRQGGVLALLGRLEVYSCYRSEYATGLQILLGIGQNSCGYKNANTTIKVATLAVSALKLYDMDAEIAAYSLTILGWCMRDSKTERRVRQLCIQDGNIAVVVAKLLLHYRLNAQVIASITWLRSIGNMHKYLPQLPPGSVVLRTLVNNNKNDNNDDEEEEAAAIAAATNSALLHSSLDDYDDNES